MFKMRRPYKAVKSDIWTPETFCLLLEGGRGWGKGVAYGVFGKFMNGFMGDAGGYNDGEDDG
jgi:hypothetical protein